MEFPDRQRYGIGDDYFPLTPALSLGEREKLCRVFKRPKLIRSIHRKAFEGIVSTLWRLGFLLTPAAMGRIFNLRVVAVNNCSADRFLIAGGLR